MIKRITTAVLGLALLAWVGCIEWRTQQLYSSVNSIMDSMNQLVFVLSVLVEDFKERHK